MYFSSKLRQLEKKSRGRAAPAFFASPSTMRELSSCHILPFLSHVRVTLLLIDSPIGEVFFAVAEASALLPLLLADLLNILQPLE